MKFLAFLCGVGLASGAFAEVYNMNVDWKFSKLNWGRGLQAAVDGNLQDGRPVYAPDYDDSAWETVSVPHPVNAHDTYDNHASDAGEASMFRGWMAYRKRLTIPAGRHFFLEFEAIRQTQYVYVDGRLVGFYEAGTAPTGYDLTPFVTPGRPALVCVLTDSSSGRGMKEYSAESADEPGDWKGTAYQWNGSDFNPVQGGLTGNVRLHVKANDAYLTLPLWANLKTTGVYVWADDFDLAKGAATIHVEAEVAGAAKQIVFALDGGARLGAVDSRTDGRTFVAVARATNLTFWSPDTPFLYDVTVRLLADGARVLDETTVRTGFRQVGFARDAGVTINGRPTWLPGYAQRSTSSWAAIGVAPDWLNDCDMELVRRSKANFIRWMHVTPKPSLVRACDKAGVVNVCPAGDKENDTSGRQWEQRVEAMREAIVYFRNAPSVFFWEAGNNQITPAHMREMRELKEALDPHGGRFMGCRTLQTAEQIAEAEYVGTMIHRQDVKAAAAMAKTGRWMPIMETEYCREESARRLWDRFTPPDFNFVCTRLASGAKEWMYNCYDLTQEEFALSNVDASDGYSYFYGNRAAGRLGRYYSACAMLCWTDCNQHGRNSNTENCRSSGRVDAVRIPKENFYVHQCLYSQTPQIKILGHWNYPKKTADSYWYNEKVNDGRKITYTGARTQRDPTRKTVYVIGSLQVASIELFVNGRSQGVATEPAKGLFAFAFPDVDVTEAGAVEAVAKDAAGNEIARDRIETVGDAAKLVLSAHVGPAGWRADGADIAVVDVKLVDAQGRVLPLADDRVTFTLTGDATFMGGWNSGTFDATSPVGKDWVNLEQGVNRVFLKASRTAGKVSLAATCANGLRAAVELTSVPVAVAGGLAREMPQERPKNAKSYAVHHPVPPVRDLEGRAGAVPYTVRVNGAAVAFPKRTQAFKPDASTGVVCPYEPVLAALKAAGADVTYTYSAKKIPANKKYLRQLSPSPYRPTLTYTAGGKEIDAVAGLTVLFEDNGREKNLTNFEMTGEHGVLAGELGPLLGYIPGLKVETDENNRRVDITVQ